MDDNDYMLKEGYTKEEFILKKDLIIRDINRIIIRKEKKLGSSYENVRNRINVINNRDKALTGGVILTTLAGTVVLDKLFPSSSYALCIGSPTLIMTSSYVYMKKHTAYQNEINKYMNLIRSIGLYKSLYDFVSNGNEMGVILLKNIYKEVYKDYEKRLRSNTNINPYYNILMLFKNIDYFNDEEYIYVEELCRDNKLYKNKLLEK